MQDKFKSRYGQDRIITKQDDGSFIVEGESDYYRAAGDEHTLTMVDFQGGPFIAVGDPLLGNKNHGVVNKIEILKERKEGSFAVKIFCD